MTPDPSDGLAEFLAAASEHRLTAAQAEAWNHRLETDAGLRRRYLERVHLEAALHSRFHVQAPRRPTDARTLEFALADLVEKNHPAQRPASRRRMAFPSVTAWSLSRIAAAVMVVACAGWALMLWHQQPAPPSAAVPLLDPPILAGTFHASWDGDTPSPGDALSRSPMTIHHGLIDVKLPSGTTIILQGPATFAFDGKNNLTLEHGSLTAHVPPAGIGFTVRTSHAVVRDLGTEFGVSVDASQRTHAEVFVGRVRVENSAARVGVSSEILAAAEAVDIASDDAGLRSVPRTPMAFVRPEQFATLVNAADGRAAAMADTLCRDPDALAFYTFDAPDGNSAVLINRAVATHGRFDGTIHHAAWEEGRSPGHNALAFDGTSSVAVAIPERLSAFTFMAWIKPEDLASQRIRSRHSGTQYNALLMTNGAPASALHWQICAGTHLELGIGLGTRQPLDFDRYHSSDVLVPAEDDQWTSVTLVCDDVTNEVRHYLNGERAGTTTLRGHPAVSLGAAQIGNWNPMGRTDHPSRGFRGRIAELGIFRRVLSDQEIQSVYAAEAG